MENNMIDSIDPEKADLLETDTTGSADPLKPVNDIWRILIAVSILLVVGTGVLRLDFLPATLLGVSIFGVNFYWTRRIVLKVFHRQNVKRRMLLIYCSKFGLSVAVLFTAIVYFQLPALGLLIGLSNIVLAVLIYSIMSVF
jgi:hypothetical protein